MHGGVGTPKYNHADTPSTTAIPMAFGVVSFSGSMVRTLPRNPSANKPHPSHGKDER